MTSTPLFTLLLVGAWGLSLPNGEASNRELLAAPSSGEGADLIALDLVEFLTCIDFHTDKESYPEDLILNCLEEQGLLSPENKELV